MPSEKRQRQKEAQRARRQAEAKQQARAETFKRIRTALLVGLAVAVALLATGNLTREKPATLPEDYLAFRSQPTACGATAPAEEKEMTFDAASDQGLDGPVTAVLATSCGDITIELDPSAAPESVNSFVFLARQGFYDGTVFDRIVPDLLARGGDQQASGFGRPGYTVADEWPGSGFVYERGVVALDNDGPGTSGGRFFIVIGSEGAVLQPRYNVVGRVVAGGDVLDRMAGVRKAAQPGTAELSRPLETVYLDSVTVEG